MDRFTLAKQNLTPNFIGSWLINPLAICNELIGYFESNQSKQKIGVTAGGQDLESKNSTDITISINDTKLPGNEVFQWYFNELFSCYKDYSIQWPFLTTFANNLQIGSFALLRYQSGQHFQRNHTERSNLRNLHRVFAWMTYLNDVDVEDGGATIFTHYDLAIQPKKGLTLIWPAEWTHAHKGQLLNANSKYIISGWMHFPEKFQKI